MNYLRTCSRPSWADIVQLEVSCSIVALRARYNRDLAVVVVGCAARNPDATRIVHQVSVAAHTIDDSA